MDSTHSHTERQLVGEDICGAALFVQQHPPRCGSADPGSAAGLNCAALQSALRY